jgi:hypothetical protein
MAARVEQSVLIFRIADLAQAHLLVGYLPVTNALAMSFAVTVAADIFVPSLSLDKGTLPVALILEPIALIGVTGRIFHKSVALAKSENKAASVGAAGIRDVGANPVPLAALEGSGIVLASIGSLDSLDASERVDGMPSGQVPVIEHESVGSRELAGFSKLQTTIGIR